MKIKVAQPGMLTTVQDMGRWGFQGKGMPVAGAMDLFALKSGNVMVGNEEGAACLEVTVLGPTLTVIEGEGAVVATGADLGFSINGISYPCNNVLKVGEGDTLSFSGMKGNGCRAYLVFSGGVDVHVVMGSRSTYLRAQIGGVDGRALVKGDIFITGEPHILWRRFVDFQCPVAVLPERRTGRPLRVVLGPQDDAFSPKGIETFFSEPYKITESADRMGYRLKGAVIEHSGGADIISDAIPLGAVQVPGDGQPIVMLADRQTTGGYTKIAVLCSPDIAEIAQYLPGQEIRFKQVSFEEAVSLAKQESDQIIKLRQSVAAWITRIVPPMSECETEILMTSGTWELSVDGETHTVSWESLDC